MDDGSTISVVQEISDYEFEVGDLVEVITIIGRTRMSSSAYQIRINGSL